uniref:Uncharacterized protein n=1 Tax=Oryza sativa subsp. japonica TaxID=39947 RepID=Q2QQJ3_ORYSJ|nr:hypothetical protein LOC_Os12g30840 [Oryza sativa Japonica Group]
MASKSTGLSTWRECPECRCGDRCQVIRGIQGYVLLLHGSTWSARCRKAEEYLKLKRKHSIRD